MSFFSFFTQQQPWKVPEEVMSQLGLCILTIFFLMCFQVWINCCPFKLKRRSSWVRWGETFGTCINPKRMLNAARGVNKPAEWGEYLWKYTTRQLDYIRGRKRHSTAKTRCSCGSGGSSDTSSHTWVPDCITAMSSFAEPSAAALAQPRSFTCVLYYHHLLSCSYHTETSSLFHREMTRLQAHGTVSLKGFKQSSNLWRFDF